MTGTNLDNDRLNNVFNADKPWLRVGECANCNARCCNLFALVPSNQDEADYFSVHGQPVVDQWWKIFYVIMSAPCRHCNVVMRCQVFDRKEMPAFCRAFPHTPYDLIYRYLMQIGHPCGYRFVDRTTGEPWDMTRRETQQTEPTNAS